MEWGTNLLFSNSFQHNIDIFIKSYQYSFEFFFIFHYDPKGRADAFINEFEWKNLATAHCQCGGGMRNSFWGSGIALNKNYLKLDLLFVCLFVC